MTIAETDEHYHDIIYNGTGNNRLVQILNICVSRCTATAWSTSRMQTSARFWWVEHDYILKAIRSKTCGRGKKGHP